MAARVPTLVAAAEDFRNSRRFISRFLDSRAGCRLAIRPAPVQINENVPRLRSFAGADDAAVFQFIHDARSAGVAEPQPALHERDAGLLLATDHLDALLDESLVLVAAALLRRPAGGIGKLFVD